jgi:hypothetical protein
MYSVSCLADLQDTEFVFPLDKFPERRGEPPWPAYTCASTGEDTEVSQTDRPAAIRCCSRKVGVGARER